MINQMPNNRGMLMKFYYNTIENIVTKDFNNMLY